MLPFFGPRHSLMSPVRSWRLKSFNLDAVLPYKKGASNGMKKFWCAIFAAYLSACATITSEPILPDEIRGWGVQLYEEGAEANGIFSYIYLRIENQTARNFDARVSCEWLDAGTDEELAREETTLRLGSYTLTRTMMRQYFFMEWRIRIRCSIEDLKEAR